MDIPRRPTLHISVYMRYSTGGQEGAGICSSDGRHLHLDKSMGLVADIFSEKRLKKLPGHIAIGHNRYSTAGSSVLKNVQPIMANFALGQEN